MPVVVGHFLPVWEAKNTPWPAGKLSRKVLRAGCQRFADKSPPCLSLLWGPCALGCRQPRFCAKTKVQSPPGRCSTNHIAAGSYAQVSLSDLWEQKGWDGDGGQLVSRQLASWLWWRLGDQSMERNVHSSTQILCEFTVSSFVKKIIGCVSPFCFNLKDWYCIHKHDRMHL